MNRSAKEKKYDNKTADYVTGITPIEKPVSIAGSNEQDDEKENPKRIIGKEVTPNPEN
jgi:hypothetical protein